MKCKLALITILGYEETFTESVLFSKTDLFCRLYFLELRFTC